MNGYPKGMTLEDLASVPRKDVMGPYPYPPGCTRARVVFRPGSEANEKWPDGWVLPCFAAEAAEVLRSG